MTLTGAFTAVCGLNIGGIKSIHMANKADVTSLTLGAGVESYETITMTASAVFFLIDHESAAFTRNDDNSTVLTADLGKLSQNSRDFIQEVKDCGDCGVIIMVTDANDVVWVIGYDEKDTKENPAIVESSTGTTAARGEDTENNISFIRRRPKLEEERTFTGTIPVT